MMRRSHGHSSEAEHRAYFQDQLQSNLEFWRRFGRRPDLQGKIVLDLGCGHGALSIDAAGDGATVLGIDLDADRVEFARRNVAAHYPELRNRIEFGVIDLVTASAPTLTEHFDIVLSKDTFEHVEDVEAMLSMIYRLLMPTGELWAGFSPLYWSPLGDHGRTGVRLPWTDFRLPWAHAFMPQALVLKSASRYNQKPVERLHDLGLNGMTSTEFFTYAERAGFHIESVLFNRGDKRFMSFFRKVREIRILERYFTIGIYTVMRRPG
jgi:SAM-dependent methyltransferase